MFDAREYLQAVERPQFIDLDGTTHPGRVLSVEEVPQLVALMDAYGAVHDPPDRAERLRVICEFCGYPVAQVRRLPEAGIAELLADFFDSQPRLREIPPR